MTEECKGYEPAGNEQALPVTLAQIGDDGTVSDAALCAAAAYGAAAARNTNSSSSSGGVRRARVGDVELDGLPDTDAPADKTAEISRRQAVVVNPGPLAVLPAALVLKRRADFEREYSGFAVVNFANVGFTTRCSVANLRVLSQHVIRDHFNPETGFDMERQMNCAYVEAQQRVFQLMFDPRVRAPGAIVPLNKPFLIPYSEASARSPRHTLDKIARNIKRHTDYTQHRNEEFERRQAECRDNAGIAQTLPELGTSEFSRRQLYLRRQELHRRRAAGENVDAALRQLDEETRPVQGGQVPIPGVGAASRAPDQQLLAAVAADAAATSAATEGKVVQGGIGLASGGATSGMLGTTLRVANAAATREDLARVGVAQDDPLLAMFTNPDAAPPAVFTDAAALPAHWQPPAAGASGSGSDSGAAGSSGPANNNPFVPGSLFGPGRATGSGGGGSGAAAPAAPSAGAAVPADLMARGKHMTLWFFDDQDTPEDDPDFAETAGKEPVVILFGGAHNTVDESKVHNKEVLAPFCGDLTLDVVDMNEWLYPTEVDPNKIDEEYRTTHTAFTQEQNHIGRQRKHNIALSAQAREVYAATGTPLLEINANAVAGLPDASAAEPARPAVTIGTVVSTGDVEARAAAADQAAAAADEAMAALRQML